VTDLGGIKGEYEVSISRWQVIFADEVPESMIQLLDAGFAEWYGLFLRLSSLLLLATIFLLVPGN